MSWILMLVVVGLLLAKSFYFQHIAGLQPCVMCIYERVCLIGLFISAAIGCMTTNNLIGRGIAFASWLGSSAMGLSISLEHLDFQTNPSPFSMCSWVPNFPSWLPLHEWMPWAFGVFASCSDSVWEFGGLTMVHWIVVIFSISTITALLFTLIEMIGIVKSEGIWSNFETSYTDD